ncbi:hypothetical protein D1007_46373 [Hordeum vulgare]|nr:hypothetical protein D1007_46373 [Hordeum vulgare]
MRIHSNTLSTRSLYPEIERNGQDGGSAQRRGEKIFRVVPAPSRAPASTPVRQAVAALARARPCSSAPARAKPWPDPPARARVWPWRRSHLPADVVVGSARIWPPRCRTRPPRRARPSARPLALRHEARPMAAAAHGPSLDGFPTRPPTKQSQAWPQR